MIIADAPPEGGACRFNGGPGRVTMRAMRATPMFADALTPEDEALVRPEAQRRAVKEPRVWWSVINGIEELTPAQEWNGRYIPIVPVLGRELQPFDGERRFVGMIRPAKDGQRLFNYAASNAVEISMVGLGAGWNETEYRAFGFPYDHRVSRFEEVVSRELPCDGCRGGRHRSVRLVASLPPDGATRSNAPVGGRGLVAARRRKGCRDRRSCLFWGPGRFGLLRVT